MEIVRNLEFQQRYFTDIYKSYMGQTQQTVNGSGKQVTEPAPEVRDKILIYTDDYVRILKDVFHLGESEQELERYNAFHEIVIHDKRVEHQEIDHFHNSCLLELSHVYRLKHYTVYLVNKLNRRYLNSVYEVILLKPLDLFSKRALKDIPFQDFVSEEKGIPELKEYLLQFRGYYNERKYIEERFTEKRFPIDENIKNLLNEFDSVLGLEVMNQILSSSSVVSKSQYAKFKRKIVGEFQDYALSILETIMEKGAFARNFELVEIYFKSEKTLQEKVSNLFDDEIMPGMIEKGNVSGTNLVIQSLQHYAMRIDNVIKEAIIQFKNEVLELEESGRGVGVAST